MSSDNPTGAVNQQETAESLELDAQWVVGFVDGEGCFNVSLHRNPFIRSTANGRSKRSSTCTSTKRTERCSKH